MKMLHLMDIEEDCPRSDVAGQSST
ncbi:hypothetical protein AALP_AA6G186600, partial [Arabis alpina]